MSRLPSDHNIRTACAKCDTIFRTATKALNHYNKRHPVKDFVAPKGDSLFGAKWNKNGTIKEIVRVPKIGL